MPSPRDPADKPPREEGGLSGLHYLLIFTAFGLFVLVVMSGKYERRQAHIEDRYRGIQELQRHPPPPTGGPRTQSAQQPPAASHADETGADSVGEDRPLIVSLRPVMLTLAVLMLLAWAGIQWRSYRHRRRVSRVESPAREQRP